MYMGAGLKRRSERINERASKKKRKDQREGQQRALPSTELAQTFLPDITECNFHRKPFPPMYYGYMKYKIHNFERG
jgi:hypothetical protein